ARDDRADDLSCFRFIVDQQHSQTLERMDFSQGDVAAVSSHRLSTICQQRKCCRESRALVYTIALRRDCATMQLDQVSHDCQSEPQAAEPPRRRTVSLTKSIEDSRQKLRIDSLAGIFHRHARVRSVLLHTHTNLPAVRGELHCVR